MKALVREKNQAITLRKNGMSYRDILKRVPVAKSSLSLWLKDLPLTSAEKYALKRRKNSNITQGRIKAAGVLSGKRLKRESVWLEEAREVFKVHVNNPFFHTGVILYWAEGSKRTNQWSFINSDEVMNQMMLLWLESFCAIDRNTLRYRLYSHKLYAHENCEVWWQKKLAVNPLLFSKTTYKPSGRGIKKRPQYKGCLRIEIPRSKSMLLKMKFWQAMLVDSYRKG
jgi:hypothetical protein